MESILINTSSGNFSSVAAENSSKILDDIEDIYETGGLYDVPLSIIIVLSLLYGGISIAALIGNLLVLWVVAVSPRMRTVTNMFIANLALADIIIGLFAIPFQFQAALLQRWNLPEFMCAFCPFVQVLSVNISAFTLSVIAVDRYRAVIFPLSVRASKKKASLAILSIWLFGLVLAFPTELDYKVVYIEEKKAVFKPFCTNLGLTDAFRKYYTLGLVVIQYFFPLMIITGAYAHITTKLWGASVPGNREESRDAVLLKNKKKVIKMLALVVLLFALCWLPLQTYNFLQTLIPAINEFQYINTVWFSCHWLAMSNSFYNPFIYAIYNDKFQREFRIRLKCTLCCQRSGRGGRHDLIAMRDKSSAPNYSECSSGTNNRYRVRSSRRFSSNTSGILVGGSGTGTTRSSSSSLSNNAINATASFSVMGRGRERRTGNQFVTHFNDLSNRRNNFSNCDNQPQFQLSPPTAECYRSYLNIKDCDRDCANSSSTSTRDYNRSSSAAGHRRSLSVADVTNNGSFRMRSMRLCEISSTENNIIINSSSQQQIVEV